MEKIRVYIDEEQPIFMEIYKNLPQMGHIELIEPISEGAIVKGDTEVVTKRLVECSPDVMIVGIKTLEPAIIDNLAKVRENCPPTGLLLLFSFYTFTGVKSLKEFLGGLDRGGFFLRFSLNSLEQLPRIIHGIAEEEFIVDPRLFRELIEEKQPYSSFLRELTPRELEILALMAKGYKNNTIAEVLSLSQKTVEHHINSILGKVGSLTSLESRYPRVQAILFYLRATGQIHPSPLSEE